MTAALTLTASTLLMASCSPKDKGEGAQISVEAAPLGLKSANEAVFARHFDVKPRKVSDEEAAKALKALNVHKEGVMSWAKKSGATGDYIYTDLGAKTDEGEITIGRAELVGVHMAGDEASFDRVNFQDMKIDGGDVNFTIGAMSIARPSPKMAQAIMTALQSKDGLEGLDDLDVDWDDGQDISLGAISIDNITIKSEEANGTLDHMVWGMDEKTQIGDGKIGKADFTIQSKTNQISKLTFEGGSARGINMAAYAGLSDNMDAAGMGQTLGLGQILGQMNLYAKPYDSFIVGEGEFTNENFEASFEGFEGKATEKGGVTTITQIGKPMRFAFLQEPQTAQANQFFQILKSLNFDEVVFKSSQTQILDANKDTMTLKDGLVQMENGFRLNYVYEAEGLSAMVEKAKADEKAGGANSNPTPAELMNALEPVKLRSMKMSLEDQSIVERGLKLASEMTGQTESNLKTQLKIAVMAAPLMASSELEGAIISEMGSAFGDFIDQGGTLTISLSPPEPLSVKTLVEARDKNLAPKALGFSASVED